MDCFLARYYSSTQGRFTSPDEFTGGPDELYDFADDATENPTFYADLTNPQSLNKYQYTYNNPINLVDPDGHCPVCPFDPQGPSRVINGLLNLGSKALDAVQTGLSAVGLLPGAGEGADLANAAISTARGNYGEAALDLGGIVGPAGSAAALGNRARKLGKLASRGDEAVDTTAGRVRKNMTVEKAENLAKADAKGIPRSQLGPSGKPKVITVKHATDKRAQDAAQARSKGRPVKHVNPTKGKTHYHATDKSGKLRKGRQNIHHETSN